MAKIVGAAPPSERLYIRKSSSGSALEVSADGVTWTALDYLTLPAGGEAGQILALGLDRTLVWVSPAAGSGEGGASAYEIAVAHGFEGTEAEWLASLQGAAGADGQDGTDGQDGAAGASAYEIAVAHGFEGTEAEWLASLQGAAGADGQDGTDGQDGSATTLTLVRPVSDLALFPVVEASASADFANAVVLDTHGSAADRAYCKVFTGDQWIDIPASGLGTPFDGLTVSVDMSTKFAGLTQPYYVRWCWRTADGADSDWSSIRFPSVDAPSPRAGQTCDLNGDLEWELAVDVPAASTCYRAACAGVLILRAVNGQIGVYCSPVAADASQYVSGILTGQTATSTSRMFASVWVPAGRYYWTNESVEEVIYRKFIPAKRP